MQEKVQLPVEQVAFAVPEVAPGQTFPQLLQLLTSELMFTQVPPQQRVPLVQAAPLPHLQVPPAQVSAKRASQAVPQLPQVVKSDCRLRQVLLPVWLSVQQLKPLAQVCWPQPQTPPTQD